MAVARLASITLDCTDPAALAALTGPHFVAVRTDRGWLAAVHVADHRPPSWPGGEIPKQMHIDLAVDDLDRAEAEAIRLGARPADVQPAPEQWRVMLEPAGYPFCLSTQMLD